ncbi:MULTISPECIES: sensor domain-containing diguanylate cyclase [unclassified Caballeronia]|uniref:sensor domain-containing diguanylate cyclase n=1 Tax=unclassified Caballeronia TaxID=2646786 RepID=UPI001F1D3838|nr:MULTISPECIES: sensor domain-containing diguanylate cyclase [unclassified Caballeronia]MCE4546499.1 GGDEF domain-containing protein [Caballeronia sp. PC1]MCE4573027.1 GGDEF domain-containing protein [Caballeronia sp. CLC5]
MEVTLLQLPSSKAHRVMAAVVVLVVLIETTIVWHFSSQRTTVIVQFLPIFGTWVALTGSLTAYLLWTEYKVTGRLMFASLSGAYAFASLTAVLQLASFPGVFAPNGLLGAGSQSSLWIWVFWHCGFPALVTTALAFRMRRVSESQVGVGRYSVVGALALAAGFGVVAIAGKTHLPEIVSATGSYARLQMSPASVLVLSISLVALWAQIMFTRLRSMLDLWLAVVLFADLGDVILTLIGGARFSVGWYAAKAASMVSSSVVLGMLMHETNRLYRALNESHQELMASSQRDGLTGVFNRSYLDAELDKLIAIADGRRRPFSVLLIDVDHFKSYNDTCGHLAGDEALKQVAHTLSIATDKYGGFAARFGGEEFVVVLPGHSSKAAMSVAEDIRERVASLPSTSQCSAPITVSIGHAAWTSIFDKSPKGILGAADAGLYRAKASGRNRVIDIEADMRGISEKYMPPAQTH